MKTRFPKWPALLALLCIFSGVASAQQAYVFLGGSNIKASSGLRYGAGLEAGGLIRIGGEIGGAGNSALFAASVSVHPLPTRFDPFIGTGPALQLGKDETAGFWHIDVGTNYWFRRNIGMRLEYRGYAGLDAANFSEVRIGLGFRL